MVIAAQAKAALTHRYSFDDGTANDSIGTANGVLTNGATVTGGQLYFDPTVNNGSANPTTGQYVSLPSNVLHTRNFTLEVWFTDRSSTPWQRLLDLGNPEGGGFIILCPFTGAASQLGQISISDHGQSGDTNFVAGGTTLSLNTEYLLTYVHDLDGGHEYLYLNNTLLATSVANQDPTTTDYHDFYIGRSNFAADPYFDGTVDELRTWDNPLSAARVSADYTAGPETLPEPASISLFAIGAFALVRRHRA